MVLIFIMSEPLNTADWGRESTFTDIVALGGGAKHHAAAEKASYQSMVAPFEKEHDVKVNPTMTPWGSYEEKYLIGVSSHGQGPEIG